MATNESHDHQTSLHELVAEQARGFAEAFTAESSVGATATPEATVAEAAVTELVAAEAVVAELAVAAEVAVAEAQVAEAQVAEAQLAEAQLAEAQVAEAQVAEALEAFSAEATEATETTEPTPPTQPTAGSAALTLPAGLTWVETNSPVASSRTDDIWFDTPDLGWLVNSNGQVCQTLDGGQTWTQQLFVSGKGPAKPYLRTIHFADACHGWFGALTNQSTEHPEEYLKVLLHQTRDGGRTWTPVTNLPKGSPGGICGLSVVNRKVVYGSGSNDPSRIGPGVIKTVDGGKSWSLIDMSKYADNLIDIYFVDENHGWVVGGKRHERCPQCNPYYGKDQQYAGIKPVVLYTEDGGKSWRNQVEHMTDEFECGGWGWKLFWVDREVGFVNIENFLYGAVLATVDGGKTWTRHVVNDSRIVDGRSISNTNLEGIGFLNRHVGWVGGWGDYKFTGTYNSLTIDGGRNWVASDHVDGQVRSDVRINANRYRFFGDPVTVGYCSGKRVYKLVLDHRYAGTLGDGQAAETTEATETTAATAETAETAETAMEAVEAATAEADVAEADVAEAMTAEPATAEVGSMALGTAGAAAGDGSTLMLSVPEQAKSLFVGIWSHFGWFVRNLLDDESPSPGHRTIRWDGLDDDGQKVERGTYICRVEIDDKIESINLNL